MEKNVEENVEAGAKRGPDVQVVFVTNKGYGIRTKFSEFRVAHRGTKGSRAMFLNDKNGHLVAAIPKDDNEAIALLTKKGKLGMFNVSDIRLTGRGLSGVRLMTLDDDDEVVAVV